MQVVREFDVLPSGPRPRAGTLAVPAPPADFVRRELLAPYLDSLLDRRLTVLLAPAGFGKTTALAEACRRLREAAAVAWLALDGADGPDMLATRVARAFERGGMDLPALRRCGGSRPPRGARQTGLLFRALDLYGSPCLLALDNVDRLPPSGVDWIDRLLRHGPPNLHLAAACRAAPRFNLTGSELDGSVAVIGAEELRFSADEVCSFFRGALSPPEVAAVRELTAGWPLALAHFGAAPGPGVPALTGGGAGTEFVETRLLRGLPADVRAGLLDLAVFDSIDPDLVDAVLESNAVRTRVVKRPELEGFFLPAGGDGTPLRLHPLVREHCRSRLALEDPARKRALHARLARALALRGRLADGWRHASAAGSLRLAGGLFKDGGGPPA